MKMMIGFLLLSNICFSQNTIIWEIKDTVSNKVSFIVGTYHHIGNSFVDSIPIIRAALLNAEIAVFESVDEPEKLGGVIRHREKQRHIKKHLSRHDYLKLKAISKDWNVDIAKLKPIELAVILEREFKISKCKTVKPTDQFDHFDNYLVYIANKNNIPLVGLENDSLQLEILNEIENTWTEDEIRQELRFWIGKLTNEESDYDECRLSMAYQRLELNYEFDSDCDDDILIKKRNEDWEGRLINLLSQRNCFIAVGYAHLKYSCGLLERFRKNGFVVKPVPVRERSLSFLESVNK